MKSAAPIAAPPAPAPAVPVGPGVPHAREIQLAVKAGRSAGKNLCALAVWRILLQAGLVKGTASHSGANAKNMGGILAGQGFRNDMKTCDKPGVVRIYDGNRSGHSFDNAMMGDVWGHMEIFGTDHKYHSYYSSAESVSQAMQRRFGFSSRRPLLQCWFKPL